MTVEECIENAKSNSNSKITSIWICPTIVREPRVGNNYTYNGGISYKPPKAVLDLEVKKTWTEMGTLCIIYVPNPDPVIFS